ncbi:DNA mismatch repair protein MutL [Hujiaoplasma nucleasis]|uniref:DNA mismatch repair protein MutL n=1 Tax=Hujiaoplasma nucleasis TaxID=2725268 RepID=A0A7L6MZA9_9MOLU|nr:GlmL-related ornithine degradation protein [Hujiaoplasma nucleasis]QLY39326.1 DNA mismatch repair protein MutL [Hujiaoplasma nucleasis]
MIIDALVAEIGSTTTVVNAFDGLESNNPRFLGSGFSPTTVLEGDVNIGLNQAIEDLKIKLNTDSLKAKETFASSSAAGGLKMSVHGLVYDMTVKAAKEAALGAGANIKMITSGILDEYQIEEIKSLQLNIIMIAGGVDYGERKTAIENAKIIAGLKLNIPIIYAGNIQNHHLVKQIFIDNNQEQFLFISDNVYPKIDDLQVEKTRQIIQEVFHKHIIHAPGMEKVKDIINHDIIPTPGAVMEASILLQKSMGDLVTVDIGGATTDIHSVTQGNEQIEKILIAPEPFSKRTVEGDLGVYVNKDNLIDIISMDRLVLELNIDIKELENIIKNYQVIPNLKQYPLTERLTLEAFKQALNRHSGHLIKMFNAGGKVTYAEGKDLTNIKHIIGTGGALTRLNNSAQLMKKVILEQNELSLSPPKNSQIWIDRNYIMASLGVLSKKHPEASLVLLKESLEMV